MPIRVVIADDEKFYRLGIIAELSKYEILQITGEARNGDELMTMLRSSPPDIVLLDLAMPKVSGMEVLAYIRQEAISVRTIVISMTDDEEVILSAIRAGAKGFFSKQTDIETWEIYAAICSVINDEFYFNEVVNIALLHGSTGKGEKPQADLDNEIQFSEMEMNIIRYMSQEMSSQQIADKTHYTLRSFENKRQEMVRRVGARSTEGLVLYALKKGLIKVSDLNPEKSLKYVKSG